MATQPPKELPKELAERWKNGERLPQLARDASTVVGRTMACASVRGWIIKAVGGLAAFKVASALRDQNHPRPAFGGGGGGSVPRPDDTDVPVITSAPIKKGWNTTVATVRGYREDVFVSPEGERYVRAHEFEKAVLIADLTKRGLGRLRLRLEHGSRQHRAQARDAKLVQHGEAQRERRAGFTPADALKRRKVRRKGPGK